MPYKVVIDASANDGYGDEKTVSSKDKIINFLANYISATTGDAITITKV
mgnify:CR=1 FL=1